uniref:DUF4446 family protein n=1 Tax=uncultured Armatimonadetes bacterium TaxID=157466 RepID=A0A6J4JKL3_9BACT|nr:hypothetical protein AVDCRST_MAG63-3547 [uncultured Armatimonadetes bacterium]
MEYLEQAIAWVRQEPEAALGAAAGAYLLLFVLCLATLIRQGALARRQAPRIPVVPGARPQPTRYGEEAAGADRAEIGQCLQKVGLVRYDAFANIGGEQSFSVALLDAGDNGLVISGIHSRSDLRIYVKPVLAGGSPQELTDEEREAITRSRAGGPDVPEAKAPAAGGGGRDAARR